MARTPDAAFIDRCTKLHDTIENATKEQVAQLVLDAKRFGEESVEMAYALATKGRLARWSQEDLDGGADGLHRALDIANAEGLAPDVSSRWLRTLAFLRDDLNQADQAIAAAEKARALTAPPGGDRMHPETIAAIAGLVHTMRIAVHPVLPELRELAKIWPSMGEGSRKVQLEVLQRFGWRRRKDLKPPEIECLRKISAEEQGVQAVLPPPEAKADPGETPGKAPVEKRVAGASPSGDSRADDPRRMPGTRAATWMARWHKTLSDDAAHFEWERLTAAGSECEWAKKEYGKAAEHYEAAAKLAERSGPPHNVYLGRALFSLAWVRSRGAGGTVDTSLYTRALAILEKNLDYPGVVPGLAGKMSVWCSQKDYAEAERLGKRFLPVVERTHGFLHDDTTKLVLALGHALALQHKHAEADQLYERWLHAAEAAGGDDLLSVITDMARNFRSAGSTSKAESMYSRALTLSESLPGGAPQEVLLELGTLYGEQGRYQEAEKLLRRCWSKAYPSYPSDTEAAEALGDVLRKTGREQEAEEIEGYARRHQWYSDV